MDETPKAAADERVQPLDKKAGKDPLKEARRIIETAAKDEAFSKKFGHDERFPIVDLHERARESYGDLLLQVAAEIFPGVVTAWAGAPEMVARHTVEIAEMLIAEVDAAADRKFPAPKSAAEVAKEYDLETASKESRAESIAQETGL